MLTPRVSQFVKMGADCGKASSEVVDTYSADDIWGVCIYREESIMLLEGDAVAARTEPLVHQLRKARPDTPILLVEDRTYTYAPFLKSARDRHTASRAALRKACETLIAAGVERLYYLEGDGLLGDDGEGATDGSHPSDLGFQRYADAYEVALRKILE